MDRYDETVDLDQTENVVLEATSEREAAEPKTKRGYRNLLQLAKGGEEEKKKACRQMMDDWNDSENRITNLKAQWELNHAQKKGVVGAYLIKEQDEHRAWIPLGSQRQFTGSNKAARLCRRIKNQLFSDPPIPEVTAEGGTETEKEKAEFSERALQINEPVADFLNTAREAFDIGHDYGSGFRHWMVHPRGGGHQMMMIMAQVGTEDINQAMIDPGQNPVLHYVDASGKLSLEPPKNPRRQWLPAIQCELLDGRHVRPIPWTTRNITTAEGVMIGSMSQTWGELKRQFPDLVNVKEEDRDKILSCRPNRSKALLKEGQKDRDPDNKNDRLVFVLRRYHKSCEDYPFGAIIIMLGDSYIAYAEQWYDKKNNEALEIPLDQFAHHFEDGNPYYMGSMEFLGPGNEIRNMLIGSLLEHLARFNDRKQFVPYTSTFQAFQNQLATGTYIPIPPGGEPKGEDIPPFPKAVEDMVPFISLDMDEEASVVRELTEAGGVSSGSHATAIIDQAIVGLTELQYNTVKAIERGWRIWLQLARAFYTVPQRISWVSDDGSHKEKRWRGTDLTTGSDIKVKAGTLTLYSKTQKTELVGMWAQMGWIGAQEAKALVASNIQATVGNRDNEHRQRVLRQISQFEDGPPQGWQPPQPQMDPQSGQQMPGKDDTLQRIFALLPMDLTPEVAMIREYEMGRAMARAKFSNFPPEWQRGMMDAYTVMRKAAGIYTLEEQAQAQQQQQQAEEKDRQAQREAAQMQQETKLQEGQIKAEAEIIKTAQSAQQRQAINQRVA